MTPCFLYLMMRPGRIAGPAAGDRAGADVRKEGLARMEPA